MQTTVVWNDQTTSTQTHDTALAATKFARAMSESAAVLRVELREQSGAWPYATYRNGAKGLNEADVHYRG